MTMQARLYLGFILHNRQMMCAKHLALLVGCESVSHAVDMVAVKLDIAQLMSSLVNGLWLETVCLVKAQDLINL